MTRPLALLLVLFGFVGVTCGGQGAKEVALTAADVAGDAAQRGYNFVVEAPPSDSVPAGEFQTLRAADSQTRTLLGGIGETTCSALGSGSVWPPGRWRSSVAAVIVAVEWLPVVGMLGGILAVGIGLFRAFRWVAREERKDAKRRSAR